MDGANVEIREAVGADNFFLFGLTATEVLNLNTRGYNPQNYINANQELRAALDLISSGYFSPDNKTLFQILVNNLVYRDEFKVCADYQTYIDCQKEVDSTYKNKEKWTEMSIHNVARIGEFSSDRAIQEYCKNIWKVEQVVI